MKKYRSESTVMPPEWDKISSATAVYHNTEITVVPASENRPELFAYTVEEFTRSEFLEYENDILRQTVNALLGVT